MRMCVTVSKLWKCTHKRVGCAVYLICLSPFLLLLLSVLFKDGVSLCSQLGIELVTLLSWCSECPSYHLQHESPTFPLSYCCVTQDDSHYTLCFLQWIMVNEEIYNWSKQKI